MLRPCLTSLVVMSSTTRSPSSTSMVAGVQPHMRASTANVFTRSEEHTSELQSQSNLVCRLLLEKKKRIVSPASPGFWHNHPHPRAPPVRRLLSGLHNT